ncbi:hypothetical protein RKE29_02155 [Streptomyces sp. B1866]|uniref:hypothetical protein n=1 Tax=Streptomyces sp. B1866 TaxID=3075431 RepID=UPI00289240A6|nr:hypothetical protein [Streptomyces sp. B1866]MDT3395464.1 hypothetical protein [Streptomyces sp. B1866]
MLTIPTDLDTWHPADVTAWLTTLGDDPTVTDTEYDQAQQAATAALLGAPAA